MKIRDIVLEDFVNYKKPSMFINMGNCDWKCCLEQNLDISICQNSAMAQMPEIDIESCKIIDMYISNPITESIVIGGLEPFYDFYALCELVNEFRKFTTDDIVIYTGYYPYEISDKLMHLSQYDNIIIKFGRFIPNDNKHIDPILGVELASKNQYAVKLNKGVQKIIKAMTDKNGYCPCRIDKNEDTRCCCLDFRNQVEGICHCGIFSK